MSTSSIRETLLREVNILPADYYPEVFGFIESLFSMHRYGINNVCAADVTEGVTETGMPTFASTVS